MGTKLVFGCAILTAISLGGCSSLVATTSLVPVAKNEWRSDEKTASEIGEVGHDANFGSGSLYSCGTFKLLAHPSYIEYRTYGFIGPPFLPFIPMGNPEHMNVSDHRYAGSQDFNHHGGYFVLDVIGRFVRIEQSPTLEFFVGLRPIQVLRVAQVAKPISDNPIFFYLLNASMDDIDILDVKFASDINGCRPTDLTLRKKKIFRYRPLLPLGPP